MEVKHDSNFPLLSLSYNYHLTNKYFLHLATRIIKEEFLFFGPNSLSNIIIKKLTRGMTMSANAFVYLYSSGKWFKFSDLNKMGTIRNISNVSHKKMKLLNQYSIE